MSRIISERRKIQRADLEHDHIGLQLQRIPVALSTYTGSHSNWIYAKWKVTCCSGGYFESYSSEMTVSTFFGCLFSHQIFSCRQHATVANGTDYINMPIARALWILQVYNVYISDMYSDYNGTGESRRVRNMVLYHLLIRQEILALKISISKPHLYVASNAKHKSPDVNAGIRRRKVENRRRSNVRSSPKPHTFYSRQYATDFSTE